MYSLMLLVLPTLMLYTTSVIVASELQSCDSNPTGENYFGRFFFGHQIAPFVNASVEMSTPTIYACRSVCQREDGCIAVGFVPSIVTTNCQLYNSARVQFHLVSNPQSSVILLLPENCTKNATVDGGWSNYENVTECSATCGHSGTITQARNCSNPERQCNGNFCVGDRFRNVSCPARNCLHQLEELQQVTTSGLREFNVGGGESAMLPINVGSDGKAWISIQERFDGSLDFYQDWTTYKMGFGNLSHEFWIGNELINKLTEGRNATLRVDLADVNGTGFAEYTRFSTMKESEDYKLSFEQMQAGDIGDAMLYHNGAMFSTYDHDRDANPFLDCAQTRHAGWWFPIHCGSSSLNGKYSVPVPDAFDRTFWYTWRPHYHHLLSTSMKITYTK